MEHTRHLGPLYMKHPLFILIKRMAKTLAYPMGVRDAQGKRVASIIYLLNSKPSVLVCF